MRRVKVTLRPEALADLKAIYRSIALASQSHAVASGFIGRISADAAGLAMYRTAADRVTTFSRGCVRCPLSAAP